MSSFTDHDRLFKELLAAFFLDFLDLFFPDAAKRIDPASIIALDKELFSDFRQGQRRHVDFIRQVRFRDRDACFLVHIETQATRQPDFAERMFLYAARLYETYRLPIYPIAVLSYDAPRTPEPDAFTLGFDDWTPLRYEFRVVQLNRLDWRDFVGRANPAASALMAKMRMEKEERVAVKLACLRLMATLGLDAARLRLASGFVDTYLRLTAGEQAEFEAGLARMEAAPREVVMQIVTSWMEEGLRQGLRQGLQQGLQQGRQEGEAMFALRQLRRRFGAAVEAEAARLQALPTERLEQLAEDMLDFARPEDLTAWLDAQAARNAE